MWLIEQLYIELGKKPFKCNTCNACFAHQSNLKIHIKNVHEGKNKDYWTIADTKEQDLFFYLERIWRYWNWFLVQKSVLHGLFISYWCDIMCTTRAVIQSRWEIRGNFFLGTKRKMVVGDPYIKFLKRKAHHNSWLFNWHC